VSFQQLVTWTAAYNSSNISFPATESTALVWNAGTATVTFAAGAVFTHAATSVNNGAATVEARIQNNGTGRITFGGPISVVPRTETSANALQQFSIAAINNSGGTLEISGTLAQVSSTPRLHRAARSILRDRPHSAQLAPRRVLLLNAPGKTLNLGSNTLTLSGNVSHSLNGSTVTATTGGFLVNATGAVMSTAGRSRH